MSGVIDEAVRLLGALQLTTERGASVRGAGVHVVVDPEWDETAQCFRVSLLCHAPAVDRPGWAGLPLLVERVDAFAPPVAVASGASAGAAPPVPGSARAAQPARAGLQAQVVPAPRLAIAARLDARGHAMLHNVPPGEYRLVAGASWVQARAPLALPLTLTSADRRLTVSLRSSAPAHVEITVAVDAAAGQGAAARFSFFDPADRVLLDDELDLARSARWEGQIDLAAAGGFACQLLRDADRPGATI